MNHIKPFRYRLISTCITDWSRRSSVVLSWSFESQSLTVVFHMANKFLRPRWRTTSHAIMIIEARQTIFFIFFHSTLAQTDRLSHTGPFILLYFLLFSKFIMPGNWEKVSYCKSKWSYSLAFTLINTTGTKLNLQAQEFF